MKELVVTEETEMEHPNVISIALHDSSFMISFPSAEDKNLWVQALHSATCQVRIVFASIDSPQKHTNVRSDTLYLKKNTYFFSNITLDLYRD